MATRNIVPRADLEGSIGTAAKRWAEAYIKTLYADDFEFGSSIIIEGSIPAVHLHGTEGSALDLTLRENAGNIEIYAETAAMVRTKWSGITGKRLSPLIVASELDTDAVETAKIKDLAVTTAKLDALAVTTAKLDALAVTTAKITDANVTYAKIQNAAGLSVPGRAGNTSGVIADITAAADGNVLRRSGTSIGFGTIVTAGLADDAVIEAKILDNNITPRKMFLKSVVAIADDTSVLSAAQLTGGLASIPITAARAKTTDTATNIIAAISGAQVGTWLELFMYNSGASAFAITITAGSGVIFPNSATTYVTPATAYWIQRFILLVTNVGTPAVSIFKG